MAEKSPQVRRDTRVDGLKCVDRPALILEHQGAKLIFALAHYFILCRRGGICDESRKNLFSYAGHKTLAAGK